MKVLDPDGNTVLLGQRERPASAAPAGDEGLIRFSVLREAAALVSARGCAPQACQVTGPDDRRCPDQAEVKLADSLGDSVWACLRHAGQILVTRPGGLHHQPRRPGHRGLPGPPLGRSVRARTRPDSASARRPAGSPRRSHRSRPTVGRARI